MAGPMESRLRERRLVGVSLKMYMDLPRTRDWMAALARMVPDGLPEDVDLFVVPGYLSIRDAVDALSGSRVAVGAQDVFWENQGAYTGEVSAPLLVQAGCRYVEIGHAERRRLFGETDADAGRKVTASVRAGLVPVLCIGEETASTPDAAIMHCAGQIAAALNGIAADREVVIAYEPVWAIGAPRPASAGHIRAVAGGLREALRERRNTRLIYGGSAGPGLLGSLDDTVDGLFLGRFAHDIDALRAVLAEASRLGAAGPAARDHA